MDRLIALEPSSEIVIRVEPGQKCTGHVTLRNVMHTMPVAFRILPTNRSKYQIQPPSGIIPPLGTLALKIIYNSYLPGSIPYSDDSFLLDSMVIPGAKSASDTTINGWFAARKNHVFTDSGMSVFFAGSVVLWKLVSELGARKLNCVREVLERSQPEWRTADSLLHVAVASSRADLVQLVLEFGPDMETHGKRDGPTALEAAAAAGEALIVELLLAHGASVGKSPASKWGPLHCATDGGHLEVMKHLLMKGKAYVDERTSDGLTSLHLAVENRRRDFAHLLLACGACADIRGGSDGNTPLHLSAFAGDEPMTKLLLTKGNAGLSEIRNFEGKTAYDTAAENGHSKLFNSLKLGSKLATSATKGEMKIVSRLIERGAMVNGKDQYGWTALMRAGFKNRMEVMKSLIEKGADVNRRDIEGYSALHIAVESGNVEAVELLVKRGADMEGKTNKGVSAMCIAKSLGYVGIERILSPGRAKKGKCGIAKMVNGKKEQILMGHKIGDKAEVKMKGSRLRMDYNESTMEAAF